MDDLVCIRKFGTKTEADVARGMLNVNGIEALIQSDDAGGMYPFMTERIRLFVRTKDKNKAEQLLKP